VSAPLVLLRGAGEPSPAAGHTLLSRRVRVVPLESPAPAAAPESILRAIEQLGLPTFSLLASGSMSGTALRVAVTAPERIDAIVLETPTAIDEEPAMRELATPTLLLYGTRDPATPAVGRRLAGILPNAHLVFVYDAGATIAADRPEAFAEVAGDFLERHEAFVISRSTTVIYP